MSINKLDETLSNFGLDGSTDAIQEAVISKSMNNLKEKMSGLDIRVEKTNNEVQVEAPEPRYDKTELADVARKIYRENVCPRMEKTAEEREDGAGKPVTIASRANMKALSRSLAGMRSSGNDGKVSPVGPNGAGNLGKTSPVGTDGIGNVGTNGAYGNYYALTTDMTLEEYEKYVQTIFEGEDCECEHEKEKKSKKVNKIPKQLDAAVKMHGDQAKTLRKAGIGEDVVYELEQKLITLGSTDWIQVDQVLREMARELDVAPRTLSREFKSVHGIYPDKWIRENLNIELCGYMPLEEAARLNKVGTVYEVSFMFRGGTNRLKFFWPMPGEATKEQMQYEVEKFWPKARLLAYYPTIDNEQQSNYMVMAPPMTEKYHFFQPEDWQELSEEFVGALEAIYEEEGDPISFVMPEEGGVSVIIEDHDSGEERKIVLKEEGLHAWFNKSSSGGKGGWVQAGGKFDGKPCARQKGQKSTPKCVSSSKRASMSKAERASAHRRKNAADPNQGSKTGAAKPTYVSTDKPKTKKEEVEYVDEAMMPGPRKDAMKKKEYTAKSGSDRATAFNIGTRRDVSNSDPIIKSRGGRADKRTGEGDRGMGNAAKRRMMGEEQVDEACWKGYTKKGMKTMFGKRYPNCVKKTKSEEAEMLDNIKSFDDVCSKCGYDPCRCDELQEGKTPAWQRKEGKNPSGGLNQKGVDSYRRANPGSKLKTAVTAKPSTLKKGGKAAGRRKSFCSRMKGMKKKLTSAKTANDPDSRINKSLRKWNC